MIDPEQIYQWSYAGAWEALLRAVHAHAAALSDDPALERAVATGLDALFAAMDGAPPEAFGTEAELLFLLHTGGFYRLPDARFEAVVVRLVGQHAGDPEAALSYARHAPEHPRCAAVLEVHAAATPIELKPEAPFDLQVKVPAPGVDHTRPLFRSQQEATFFRAVREVFATYVVYPNVALHSVLDYDALQPHLEGAERAYFFRALIDCVVFDQHEGYRPRFFFELDSPLHDAPERQAKDRRKDRLLALAGQRLWRIRPHTADADQAAFVALLRSMRDEME